MLAHSDREVKEFFFGGGGGGGGGTPDVNDHQHTYYELVMCSVSTAMASELA